MSKHSQASRGSVSRRDFINIGAVGGCGIIAFSIAGPASAAQKKFTQQQAKYQPVPKSGQRCQTCALWQAPTSCQVVEGPVSPAGWCMLYQARS